MNVEKNGTPKRTALGRGLGALIPGAPSGNGALSAAPGRAQVMQLAIEDVQPDDRQPRHHFDSARLEELASSIKNRGVLQPILVRREQNRYTIIAGERRWRAAQLAGLKEVPAILKEASEKEAFEIALIENLQRQDLNPIEEAEGYRRLLEEHGLTQELVATRVGKDRSSVANSLRLLNLPQEMKSALVEGSLNMGHARALLGLPDAEAMKKAAAQVMAGKLNVRATEQLVRKLKSNPEGDDAAKKREDSPQVRALTEQLQRALGTKAKIVDNGGKGRVELEFFSYEDLDRILARLLPERR